MNIRIYSWGEKSRKWISEYICFGKSHKYFSKWIYLSIIIRIYSNIGIFAMHCDRWHATHDMWHEYDFLLAWNKVFFINAFIHTHQQKKISPVYRIFITSFTFFNHFTSFIYFSCNDQFIAYPRYPFNCLPIYPFTCITHYTCHTQFYLFCLFNDIQL